eukprot:CAMPEP_0171090018 /NCGR_PEP_ID=MMETSP0766_2-20121228/28249_1 /TAXON_ID=439317 /ORGANISM="Gambierdiscus australes, Strain CAWD 149" /LENGTH=122 /DNA_ID=CAMNT_0011547959 /DNA_START=89 /DNA_END=457 /DNA_ORIENTATION=+
MAPRTLMAALSALIVCLHLPTYAVRTEGEDEEATQLVTGVQSNSTGDSATPKSVSCEGKTLVQHCSTTQVDDKMNCPKHYMCEGATRYVCFSLGLRVGDKYNCTALQGGPMARTCEEEMECK